MNIEAGSYEARKRQPELLQAEAVIDLVPTGENRHADAIAATDEMLAFMQSRKLASAIDIKTLINEGRE